MIIQNDISLKEVLWYRIGGNAKHFIICENREDVLEALDFIKNNSIQKVFVVGLGSNLIFTDDYFDGAVLQLAVGQDPKESIHMNEDNSVDVFAGVVFDDLIRFTFENKLIGLEWAGGLPGTVGGAVRGNAGAYGGEVKDSLVYSEVLDFSAGEPIVKTIFNDELQFSYRNSYIKRNKKLIVLSAKFGLKKTDDTGLENARVVYDRNTQNRKDKHPLEYPNTGSVFINPRRKEEIEKILSVYPELRENVEKKWFGKVAVASLIDKWGLKGFRIGDAQISEKHALFIVNLGHAKASEVLQVIDTVKEKFKFTFGFELEVEVEIVN